MRKAMFVTEDLVYFFKHFKQMYHFNCCLLDNLEYGECGE